MSLDMLSDIATEYSNMDNDLLYAHITTDVAPSKLSVFNEPVKVDGSLFVLLTKGSLRLNFNFDEFTVTAPAVMSLPHGSIIELLPHESAAVEIYVLLYSLKFMQDVHISFSSISGSMMVGRKSPVLELRERDTSLLTRHISLIKNVMADDYNNQLTTHIVSSLTSALFYQVMLVMYKTLEPTTESLGQRPSGYVHDFIKLVHLYYTKERSVNFYASKLFISPKYLSLLVKEATGISAARWIDRFVITEAKNLLRFSGKNIQQVAYTLNFPNQSSFGKYFKHLTGMSPSEFQKS